MRPLTEEWEPRCEAHGGDGRTGEVVPGPQRRWERRCEVCGGDFRSGAALASHRAYAIVSPADGISFLTYHEQVQPNAVKTLAETTVRIIIQLPPRHVLPLVRQRRQVAAGDDESDSYSDSSSNSNLDSEEGDASDSGDCRSGAERSEASPTIDPHQLERQWLRRALEPLFQKARR